MCIVRSSRSICRAAVKWIWMQIMFVIIINAMLGTFVNRYQIIGWWKNESTIRIACNARSFHIDFSLSSKVLCTEWWKRSEIKSVQEFFLGKLFNSTSVWSCEMSARQKGLKSFHIYLFFSTFNRIACQNVPDDSSRRWSICKFNRHSITIRTTMFILSIDCSSVNGKEHERNCVIAQFTIRFRSDFIFHLRNDTNYSLFCTGMLNAHGDSQNLSLEFVIPECDVTFVQTTPVEGRERIYFSLVSYRIMCIGF